MQRIWVELQGMQVEVEVVEAQHIQLEVVELVEAYHMEIGKQAEGQDMKSL